MSPLSPLDGRYSTQVAPLLPYFSENALIKARVSVEVRYLIALSDEPNVKEIKSFSATGRKALLRIAEDFSDGDAAAINRIEKTTRHDVKACEYWLQKRIGRISGMKNRSPFIHFALTSEDINNCAYGMLVNGALKGVIRPALKSLVTDLRRKGGQWDAVAMLSLTHGQPATPTTVGRELMVFTDRLERQLDGLKRIRMHGKFGGAVGNFAAHRAAYPDVRWDAFGRRFLRSLGLTPLAYTTQINPHDDIAELSHLMHRIDTILLDLSRDLWMYISRGVFRQKTVRGEVGSSTMPHKVNPIDFENAEGNIGLANALFAHFAEKLPVSRLQRDLSDSTVQRNLGVAFGHHLLAVRSLQRGLKRIAPDRRVLKQELLRHPEVAAEAIQTVLRKHGIGDAYEQLKTLTRGRTVSGEDLRDFVEGLQIPKGEREHLRNIIQ